MPVAIRYPIERRKMLELIQVQRGDRYLSHTIALALDEFIERYLRERPMALEPTPAPAGAPNQSPAVVSQGSENA